MGKKVKAKTKTKKKINESETQISEKERKMVFHKLQQVVESYDKSCNSNSSSCTLLHTKNKTQFSKRDSTFVQHSANSYYRDTMDSNYKCYRCKHFLEIPRNLSQPFCKGIPSFIGQCEAELSFIQAIVWLKSATACVSQISVKQLQLIFKRQWSTRDNCNYPGNRHIDVHVERLKSSVNKDLSSHEDTSTTNTFVSSSPLNIFNLPYNITPQKTMYRSYTSAKNLQNEEILDESLAESLTPERQNIYNMENKKEKEFLSRSCIISETDVEFSSDLNNTFESSDMFGSNMSNMPEHQNECLEENTKCSMQTVSTNYIEQVNKEIIGSKNIFLIQKTHTDISNEHESVSSARKQSIESTFDLEYNFNRVYLTPMMDQSNLADELLSSDCNSKSLVRTEVDSFLTTEIALCNKKSANNSQVSRTKPISNVFNDDSFEFPVNDNSSNMQMNITIKPIIGIDHMTETNTRCCYEVHPYKKETIACKEIISPSIISPKMFCKRQKSQNTCSSGKQSISKKCKVRRLKSPLMKNDSAYSTSNIDVLTTQVDVSQSDTTLWKQKRINNFQIDRTLSIASNAFDGDRFEFQIDDNDPNTLMKVMMKPTIDNKRTSDTDSRRRYELRSHKKKSIADREKAVSPSILRLPKTLRKGQILHNTYSSERQSLLEKRTVERPKKSSTTKKENKEEMISANWLSFTLESLNIEYIILESLKVILLTLCDERTAEEYAVRGCWKDTLEEEAVNAVLNISDIFRMEKKPNICKKEIVTTVINTLDKMLTCVQLIKTSAWINRVHIILELCNSLPICIEIIDYLIAKTKSFQSVLIDIDSRNVDATINKTYLLFYALNIAIRKYRTIIPSDQKYRSEKITIPHVADLWKMRYIDEELEDISLNTDIVEERWSNELENFTVESTKHFVQFAEKSLLLVRVLIPQFNIKT